MVLKRIIFLVLLFFNAQSVLLAQEETTDKSEEEETTEKVESDSTKQSESVVETTVFSSAADSMNFNFFTQTTYLYGNAKVTYGKQEITAAIIELKRLQNLVKAYGVIDSTGALVGLPVFKDGPVVYNAEEILYNYKTKKGIINKIITEQSDGFVQGARVKKTPENELFLQDAIYTTCNLADPHFAIRSKQLKLVPGKYVISGPFNMEINKVPTPLGFALGLFPFTDKRSSGVIMPNYGESKARGFFLRDGGIYLALSDYVGMKLTGEIYSLGGWGTTLDVNYKKRYRYNGGLNISYRNVQRQTDDLTESTSTDYWVRWNHTPQSRGSSRFSASVNAGSSSFNRNNSQSISDFLAPTFNSNINYSKTFENTPFSFNSSLRQNLNTITNIATINPDVSLAMNRIFPLEKLSKKKNFLTQLSLSYSGNLKGKITNDPKDAGVRFPFQQIVGQPDPDEVVLDTLDLFANFGKFVRNTRYGMTHRIPISTNLTIAKHFQVTPSVNYQEEWYPNRYNYTWVDSLNAVKIDTISQLSRSYQYNFSAGVTTRMYALYYFKNGASVRHMMTPNLSYSYQPDFSDPRFGFYQEVQNNQDGNSQKYPIFQGGGVPPQIKSSSISFGLDNQFEMKVKSKKDTTQKEIKMPLLQNASIRSSYNFAADSFQLANFSLSTRTTILKKININVSGTVDPYSYVPVSFDSETGEASAQLRRTPVLAWQQGQGLGRLTNASLNLTTNLSPDDFKKKRQKITDPDATGEDGDGTPDATKIEGESTIDETQLGELDRQELEQIRLNPQRYVDFNMPWSLNFNYTLNYSKDTKGETKIVQTLNFGGEIKLTEKWRISAKSGYDFENKEFAFTTFNIFRDLHCWQMALSWVPFGQRQSYSIDISVKSSILQDLKISKRNSWFDR